ncbi:uncharacterized protein [Struthio camelus]|uniref:uncharacterized protein n=1 Tax=Struthio camelus TaxID=8801 RepID=UPI0036041242
MLWQAPRCSGVVRPAGCGRRAGGGHQPRRRGRRQEVPQPPRQRDPAAGRQRPAVIYAWVWEPGPQGRQDPGVRAVGSARRQRAGRSDVRASASRDGESDAAARSPQPDGNEDGLRLAKRKRPTRGEGRKRPGGPAAERQQEPREVPGVSQPRAASAPAALCEPFGALGRVHRGLATETLYGQLGCSAEAHVEGETTMDGGCYGAKRSKKMVQQNLRELLSFLRLLVNTLTILLIELVHFFSESVIQVLVVGVLTAIGDHMLKPLLVTLSNSILQPLLLFLLNILCGVRDLTYPVIDILEGICLQVAVVLRAFRLVEINVQLDRGAAQGV